jgi:hypothetical protein
VLLYCLPLLMPILLGLAGLWGVGFDPSGCGQRYDGRYLFPSSAGSWACADLRIVQQRVLELIMTAPMIVASWISLQYYGSTVAPKIFGGGNKLLHNVTGGIGVVEGNGGLLRAGLAWQSVHDGECLVHEPLRLSVCIEAPAEAITDVLRRHQDVRDLCDNHWLHLFQLDETGRMAWRYAGDLQWTAVAASDSGPRGSTQHGEGDSPREAVHHAR